MEFLEKITVYINEAIHDDYVLAFYWRIWKNS